MLQNILLVLLTVIVKFDICTDYVLLLCTSLKVNFQAYKTQLKGDVL